MKAQKSVSKQATLAALAFGAAFFVFCQARNLGMSLGLSEADAMSSTGQYELVHRTHEAQDSEVKTLESRTDLSDTVRQAFALALKSGQELRHLTREFTKSDLDVLSGIALDSAVSWAERESALVLLAASGPRAHSSLAKIALSPEPHAAHEPNGAPEREIRMRAIAALDEAAADGSNVTRLLESIADKQSDRVLVFLAETSLDSIMDGHPGKLTQMVAQMIEKERAN